MLVARCDYCGDNKPPVKMVFLGGRSAPKFMCEKCKKERTEQKEYPTMTSKTITSVTFSDGTTEEIEPIPTAEGGEARTMYIERPSGSKSFGWYRLVKTMTLEEAIAWCRANAGEVCVAKFSTDPNQEQQIWADKSYPTLHREYTALSLPLDGWRVKR